MTEYRWSSFQLSQNSVIWVQKLSFSVEYIVFQSKRPDTPNALYPGKKFIRFMSLIHKLSIAIDLRN